MTVSRRLRFEILKRDDSTCRYCGANPRNTPDVAMTIDHVIPTTLGGGDEPSNLVACCQPCNAGKSSVPVDAAVVDQVADDAVRWARAMHEAAFYRAIERDGIEQTIDEWNDIWTGWRSNGIEIPKDAGWRQSLRNFISNGLPSDEMEHLIEVAMHSKASAHEKWKFFCGCCWRSITDLQETARQLIEDGKV